jgi:hypothetical protein
MEDWVTDERGHIWRLGDFVRKIGGDYAFEGWVVMLGRKLKTKDENLSWSTQVRLVVQNRDGVLHIFSPGQLERIRHTVITNV